MGFYAIYLGFIALLCGRYNLIKGKYLINKTQGYHIAIWIIIIVSSLRFNIGYDWSQYFSFVYPVFNPSNIKRFEPFNKVIYYLAGTLHQPIILFAIYALITYKSVGDVIEKYSVSRYESLAVYLCLFYLITLSTLRQSIAVAIIFYGLTFIKQRKFCKYLFICILAMCFHTTAIIGILFYPLYYFNRWSIIIIVVLVLIGFKIVLPYILGRLFPYFMIYLKNGGIKDSSGSLQKYFYLFIYIYCFVLHPKSSRGYLNICTIGVILPFILGGHTGGRIAEYFLIYYCLLIPECNKRMDINYRILFLIPFYVYFFIYLYVSVAKNHSDEYVPFRWYFLENLKQSIK